MNPDGIDQCVVSLVFILFGYLSGSVLYARVFASLFGRRDILSQSADQNPGTANAFKYGGFYCGLCTLVFDLFKGFLPVYAYVKCGSAEPLVTALVVAAPVLGHAFPLFYRFRGGKGIAVSFGALAGLYPALVPLLTLAFFFIAFSTVVKITPNFHRTGVTYVCTLIALSKSAAAPGFAIITAIVLLRLRLSREERGRMEVSILGRPVALLRNRRGA